MEFLDEQVRVNHTILRDCLAGPIILKSTPVPRSAKAKRPKGRKTSIADPVSNAPSSLETTGGDDDDAAADLAEFIDVIHPSTFQSSMPESLRL